jgi:hypothetical protein
MLLPKLLLISLATGLLFASACATVTENGASPTQPSNPQSPPPSVDRSPAPPASRPPLSGECDATKAQWALGERATNEVLERARVAAQAGTARFLRPNQVITLEYSSARLNLGLDEKEIVRNVRCG